MFVGGVFIVAWFWLAWCLYWLDWYLRGRVCGLLFIDLLSLLLIVLLWVIFMLCYDALVCCEVTNCGCLDWFGLFTGCCVCGL